MKNLFGTILAVTLFASPLLAFPSPVIHYIDLNEEREQGFSQVKGAATGVRTDQSGSTVVIDGENSFVIDKTGALTDFINGKPITMKQAVRMAIRRQAQKSDFPPLDRIFFEWLPRTLPFDVVTEVQKAYKLCVLEIINEYPIWY